MGLAEGCMTMFLGVIPARSPWVVEKCDGSMASESRVNDSLQSVNQRYS